MRSLTFICAAGIAVIGSCGASAQVFPSSAGNIAVETMARGLDHPWSLAFLPDGRMLVTERPGRMRIAAIDGKLSPPLAGVPKVMASGQGGLLDVALDRGYAQNATIYFCFAEPAGGGARTALARARLVDDATPRLEDVKVIFQQEGPLDLRLDFDAPLGSGVVMVFGPGADLEAAVLRIAGFFRDESCGQCVPCRIGTVRQEEALLRLAAGRANGNELEVLDELAQVMRDASICGLGQTASSAIESALATLDPMSDREPTR